jgi:hypothetical protein
MKNLFIILFSITSLNGFGQTLTLDLSQNLNNTFTQSIDPQTITQIALVNKVLSPSTVKYSVDIQITRGVTIPLTMPGVSATTAPLGSGAGVVGCTDLENATGILKAEPSEASVPSDITSIQSAISNANATTCANDIKDATATINSTKSIYALSPKIVIGSGDQIIITITKDSKNKWVYDYKATQVNHVIVFYGFTYVPDLLTSFPNYYAKQLDTGGKYQISRMNGNTKNVFQNISPTVMFTYRFFKNEEDQFKFGLTGGFTYNTQTLGALFGPSLVIGNVISINTGISFLQKYALDGQYQEGQIISDNLTFDQLHTKIWTYDLYFSIGFNIPSLFNNKSGTGTSGSSSAKTTTD